jgi:hypothetical protein
MGGPGPDRGKGGKYLILPPDYKGEVPFAYFAARSSSCVNLLALRDFWWMAKRDVATKNFKEGVRIYALAQVKNPPRTQFISLEANL